MITPILGPLLLVMAGGLVAFAVTWALARRTRRHGAPDPAPRCGACGYDTTGLTQLTCPECGSDLRAAGILTGQAAATVHGFIGSAVLLLGAWLICGIVLASVVSPLIPVRCRLAQKLTLSGPASNAYLAANVEGSGVWWGVKPPRMGVTIELERRAGDARPGGRPMRMDPASGAYEYLDARGVRVNHASGFNNAAVLAWLSDAGIDAADERVRAEARAIELACRRAGRARRALSIVTSGSGMSSVSGGGGSGSTFSTTRVSESYAAYPPTWIMPTFGVVWIGVGACGIVYLWRTTRRPDAAATRG